HAVAERAWTVLPAAEDAQRDRLVRQAECFTCHADRSEHLGAGQLVLPHERRGDADLAVHRPGRIARDDDLRHLRLTPAVDLDRSFQRADELAPRHVGEIALAVRARLPWWCVARLARLLFITGRSLGRFISRSCICICFCICICIWLT